MSADSDKTADKVQAMFGAIARRYDLANTALSFGIHHLWKYCFCRVLPRKDLRVLDLCTGTGDLLPALGTRYGSVVGGDFCAPMLEQAQHRFKSKYPLAQLDALHLGIRNESFDLVTVSFGVRNFEDLEAGVREIFRVLKPGGHLAILEFGQPAGLFGAIYRWYSKTIMPAIGALVTGCRSPYEYLPKTAATFPSGEALMKLLEKNGFTRVELKPLSFGIAYTYLAHR